MKSKKAVCTILMCALLITSVLPCYGATTQDKINNARTAKEEAESNLSDTKSQINDLKSQKSESETYLSELNVRLEKLKENLLQLQKESEEKQTELEKIQKELEEAKVRERKQYEDMKLRIQFMYEKSSTTYLDMLLTASSFTEFLNRADNISQISEYDRDMLTAYQEVQKEIEDKEASIKEEQEAIRILQQESTKKQNIFPFQCFL